MLVPRLIEMLDKVIFKNWDMEMLEEHCRSNGDSEKKKKKINNA